MIDAASASTSVFCAVWNKDPDRHSLLRSHLAVLAAQTTAVNPVYVFDDGDEPPPWLDGTIVVAPHPLTIYQAWNLGVRVADTEYVMNLNLDDRLAPDAVALLEDAVRANDTGLAAGEWNICFTQQATDEVVPSYTARRLPFLPAWPPATGLTTRLGSGTGERGTLGPGTLWRRDLHDRVPYPWQFASGDPIKIVGDLAWWGIVGKHLNKTAIRLPLVIGNYHSHPADQAEFRSADEHAKLSREGIRPGWYPLEGITVSQEQR
jgi:hypothetical protein